MSAAIPPASSRGSMFVRALPATTHDFAQTKQSGRNRPLCFRSLPSKLRSDRERTLYQPHFISPLATFEPISRATPMPRLGNLASIAAFRAALSLALANSSSNATRYALVC
ncbi:hypothetical protein ACVWXO_010626 [Bradyrhizobium sp. LM2.7]